MHFTLRTYFKWPLIKNWIILNLMNVTPVPCGSFVYRWRLNCIMLRHVYLRVLWVNIFACFQSCYGNTGTLLWVRAEVCTWLLKGWANSSYNKLIWILKSIKRIEKHNESFKTSIINMTFILNHTDNEFTKRIQCIYL